MKRRLGPAWLQRTPDGGFARRRGRPQPGYLDEPRAIVAKDRVVREVERDLAERAAAADRAANAPPTFRDVARAYLLLATSGEPGGVYNLCAGRATSLREALDMLVGASGLDVRIEVDPARLRPVDSPRMVGSYAKLRDATGWEPEIPLQQTLADLYAYEAARRDDHG